MNKPSPCTTVYAPTSRSMKLFGMCRIEGSIFSNFDQSESFRQMFDVDIAEHAETVKDDDIWVEIAMRLL